MKPIRNPKNDIENVIINVGTFSPMAPYTAKVSFATLLLSSFGLIVSNQPISYLKMAAKYLFLNSIL